MNTYLFINKTKNMKLNQFLSNKFQTEFEVSSVEMQVAERDGKKIAILHLKKPIDVVEGSQFIPDELTGENVRVMAYDVDTVRIYEDDFEADGVEINDDGTGVVKSNLRLDVSKRTGEVWLKSISFRTSGNEMRRQNIAKSNNGMIQRIQERRTVSTFSTAGENQTNQAKTDNKTVVIKPTAEEKVVK